MNYQGLSVDQAPPISIPFRFFLSAPIFGIIAGLLILSGSVDELISRYSPLTIAITHAVAIGVLSLTMFGALFQMLPVLAGVSIPKQSLFAKISHSSIIVGLLLMLAGFLSSSKLLLPASLLLGIGFMSTILPMLYAFRKVINITASVRAMITSLIFALLITLMGMHLLASHGLGNFSASHMLFANIHSVWAIFGFAGPLIIGVAFHILPMFYVAPRFKRFCKQKVVWLITFGLILWLILNIALPSYSWIAKAWVAMFFWAFSTTVFLKMRSRRRPTSDVTVYYWISASIFMTLGTFAWVFDDLFDEQYIVLVSILIGGGFIFSIVQGMLYKIVPFLAWFHLNARGYMSIPTLHDMVDRRVAKWQFFLYIFSLIGFIFSFLLPTILPLFALSFMVSMALLEYNLIKIALLYARISKTKPDFDMSAFA
ncbi:MAG: hypothetical protein WCR69_05425 [Sulfuricurvum sp.]